jgi:hypothetical protein
MKPWSETYALRRGYSVWFIFDGEKLDVEWCPRMPRGKLGLKLLPDYYRARNAFFSTLTPTFGNILVVDL